MNTHEIYREIVQSDHDTLFDLHAILTYNLTSNDDTKRAIRLSRGGRVAWDKLPETHAGRLYSKIERYMPAQDMQQIRASVGIMLNRFGVTVGSSEGYLEVKTRTKMVYDSVTDSFEERLYRYLYLRAYGTSDIKRNGKGRLLSIYIGSLNRKDLDPFISNVLDGVNGFHPEDIINVYRNGGYDAIKTWRNEVNGR